MLQIRPQLDIIIPVFNEEECLLELFKRLLILKKDLEPNHVHFIFVNDGSKDQSSLMLNLFAEQNDCVSILEFSRNFGHQLAITAGLDNSEAEYAAIIDADLQDPPELIKDLFFEAKKGFDIVYAKRRTRKGETVFKKMTAKAFYYFLSKMCDVSIPLDTGDFRLISSRVVNELRLMRERHRFVRGLIPWIGFETSFIDYDRDSRYAGETKYPLKKMIAFSKDAIFSFSKTPLKVTSLLGYLIVMFGIVGSIFMLYVKLYTSLAVPGITAIILSIIIIGGIQIILLGIIGEYVGRIFEESKGRPLYIVAKRKNLTKQSSEESINHSCTV